MASKRELVDTAAFTISLLSQHAAKLENLAREAGVPPEELLRAKVENWLARPEADFAEAAAYVVKKNTELYRRLA